MSSGVISEFAAIEISIRRTYHEQITKAALGGCDDDILQDAVMRQLGNAEQLTRAYDSYDWPRLPGWPWAAGVLGCWGVIRQLIRDTCPPGDVRRV